MTTAKKNKKGFTLIELLIVIAVLGTLSTFAILNFRNTLKRGRDTRRIAELQQYQNLMEVYATAHNNQYLAGSGSISGQCSALGETSCPVDPTPGMQYSFSSTTTSFVLWAELETSETGVTEYYVYCSNGKSDKVTTQPSSSTCPL